LGGFVSYRLLDGPAAGRIVYVAEDIVPTVREGQQVAAGEQIATMHTGSAGIETGWASGQGTGSLAATGPAGGISAGGPFPTKVGINFDQLLATLGVKPSPGINSSGSGANPGLPNWSGNTPGSPGVIPASDNSSGGISSILASTSYNAQTCAWGLDLGSFSTPHSLFGFPLPSLSTKVGFCILTKTQARALLGGLLLWAGALTFLVGCNVLVVYSFRQSKTAQQVGTILQFVPGVGRVASVALGKMPVK
jgi:hypothetical protein